MPPLANFSIPPTTWKKAYKEEQATTSLTLSDYNSRKFDDVTAAYKNPNH